MPAPVTPVVNKMTPVQKLRWSLGSVIRHRIIWITLINFICAIAMSISVSVRALLFVGTCIPKGPMTLLRRKQSASVRLLYIIFCPFSQFTSENMFYFPAVCCIAYIGEKNDTFSTLSCHLCVNTTDVIVGSSACSIQEANFHQMID